MMRKILLVAILVGLAVFFGCSPSEKTSSGRADAYVSIVPVPSHIEMDIGTFEIFPEFRVLVAGNTQDAKDVAEYFTERLRVASGFEVPVGNLEDADDRKMALALSLNSSDENLGEEGYRLEVKTDGIDLKANHAAGLFYGIQTIFQLMPAEIYSGSLAEKDIRWTLPCLKIEDIPRYPYRGMHLDVCRHFFPKSFIKKYIDLLALHKFNTFHWHLTEDQGWRIEIKKYPELTEVGAYRKETLIGHVSETPQRFDGKRYGGFYNQEDIKEIVAYARERFITVIPEIEMPGHSTAALASYPELSCTGGPFETATRWGVFEDVYCAGNDRVFEFLEDVLTEVIDLFPGTYIHVGGDECPKIRWETCEKCQARIREEGLADEHELQSYFIRRIEKFLLSKGRRLIGWDEILEGGLAPEATVMSWRGMEGGIEAAKEGHDVIMTPTSHCYFDYYQDDPEDEPLAIGGLTPLKKVYAFEPTPGELNPEEAKHILGAQGNLWTEYIDSPEKAEYMSLPRLCALAEAVWSPDKARNWKGFVNRLNSHFSRLDAMRVNYRKGPY